MSIRLRQADGINHLIYQFATEANLRAWERSDEREALLRAADEHSLQHRQTVTACPAVSDAHVSVNVLNSNDGPKWRR